MIDVAPLLTVISDSTINGKRAGITLLKQSESPSDAYFIAISEFLIISARVKRIINEKMSCPVDDLDGTERIFPSFFLLLFLSLVICRLLDT